MNNQFKRFLNQVETREVQAHTRGSVDEHVGTLGLQLVQWRLLSLLDTPAENTTKQSCLVSAVGGNPSLADG